MRKKAKAYEIPVSPETGRTFHGRDLFAPFIVSVLRGKKMKLRPLLALEGRPFPVPFTRGGEQLGEIVHADHYGNLVTSIPIGSDVSTWKAMRGSAAFRSRAAENYETIPDGGAGLYPRIPGLWEIACRRESAADLLADCARGIRFAWLLCIPLCYTKLVWSSLLISPLETSLLRGLG